jgi:hypothetical protein
MKRILILLLLLLSFGAKAQFIESKLNIYLSSNHYLNSAGAHFIEKEGFISPSLFQNMETIRSFSAKGLYAHSSFLSLGVGVDATNYSNWVVNNYTHYTGSSIRELVVYPTLQFHPKRKELGFLNRFKPNVQFSPLLGMARADFPQPAFLVVSEPKPDLSPILSSSDFLFGIKTSLGVEMIINRFVGLTANYGIKNVWLSPDIYQDKWVFQAVLDGGVYIRFNKNKRFYY